MPGYGQPGDLQVGGYQTDPRYSGGLSAGQYSPAGVGSVAPSSVDMGSSFNTGQYAGLGAGGLLTFLGGIGAFQSTRQQLSRSDFDYDPSRYALAAYNRLSDPRSPYYRSLLGYYQRIAGAASPSLSSLLGVAASGGTSYGGSTALAYQQSKAQSSRNRDAANQEAMQTFIGSQGQALNALGMEQERARFQTQGYNQYAESRQNAGGSFYDQLLGLGGGLLSKFI